MKNFYLFCLGIFWSFLCFAQVDSHLLLELKRAEAHFNQVSYEYREFQTSLSKKSIIEQESYIESLVSTLSFEVDERLKEHSELDKGMVKKLFSDIKTEAKLLTRTHGLAISIAFLTIELTELPMKAVALSLGSPVIIVLYEVLQPGLTIPAATIAIQSIVKNYKMKKIFADNISFKKWRKNRKEARKKIGFHKNKAILTEIDGEFYRISSSGLITRILQKIGIRKGRLDYSNLMRFVKKNKLNEGRIKLLSSQKNIPPQIRAELILKEILKSKNGEELLTKRFKKSFVDIDFNHLDEKFLLWLEHVLEAKDKEELKILFENIPETISPLVFMELWESVLMEEFFENNDLFKLKYYRYLSKNLLNVVTKLRKEAYQSMTLKTWDDSSRELIKNYLLNSYFN